MKKLLILLLCAFIGYAIMYISILVSTPALSETALTIDNKEIIGKDLKNAILKIMPSEQKALHRIANKARDINKRAETKVAKQQVWVDGQHELCESSEFNAFKLKKNFIGRLRSFGLNPNDGTYNIAIAIHPDNTNYRKSYDNTQNQVIQTDVEKNIFKSDIYDLRPGYVVRKGLFLKYKDEGDLVRFSGYFSRKGNRKPNCFKQTGIGLFYNKWAFEFNSIEKIPVREY